MLAHVRWHPSIPIADEIAGGGGGGGGAAAAAGNAIDIYQN